MGNDALDHAFEAVKDKIANWRNSLKPIGYFLLKAFAVVIILSFIRDCATMLPSWLLLIVFLTYALFATFGSMYDVVTTRLHKQDLYTESGKLSHFNRRWVIWFGVLFIIYLFSAIVFVLQTPSLDAREWLLIWAAPAIFCIIYLIMRKLSKKEYSSKYYKARAIRWSTLISALILTILYAVFAFHAPLDQGAQLATLISNREFAFEHSDSSLMAELDKLTSFSNSLNDYFYGRIEGQFSVAAVLIHLVIGFSVFIGISGLFSSCLLSFQEISSEFRLLPSKDGNIGSVQGRYFILLTVIWLMFSCGFMWLDQVAKEARSTNEHTVIDEWINETTNAICLTVEEDLQEVKEDHKVAESKRNLDSSLAEGVKSLAESDLPVLKEAINGYYDECAARIDDYVGSYEEFPINIAHIIPFLNEGDMLKDKFKEKVIDGVDTQSVDDQYERYLSGLKGLYNEYVDEIGIYQVLVSNADDYALSSGVPSKLQLWPTWDSEEGKRLIQNVLMDEGSDSGAMNLKERILGYIESQRNEKISYVEELPSKFFPGFDSSGS